MGSHVPALFRRGDDSSVGPQEIVAGQASGVKREAPQASGQPPRLLDRLRAEVRVRHYSLRTEQAYVDWARRYIRFHGLRHPQELGAAEVAAFLTYLAVQREVSASTQAQARSALLFLYREVLGVDLPWLQEVVVAKSARRLPVVLTAGEVRALLAELSGTMGLVAGLLYGIRASTTAGARLHWVSTEFLMAQNVSPWGDMPVWMPGQGETAGFHRRSNAKAVAAQLTFRSLADTVAATRAWFAAQPAERRNAPLRAGIKPEREAEVLAAWKSKVATPA